jgi:hypothetical protein
VEVAVFQGGVHIGHHSLAAKKELGKILSQSVDGRPGIWKTRVMIKTKRNRFRNYISVEVAVIIGVLASFKLIENIQLAALVAGSLFILSTLGILAWEVRFNGYQRRVTFWGLVAFLFLSALPIMGLRLYFWGVPWAEVSFFGLTGPFLHQASNHLFLVLMVCFFIDSFLENKRQLDAQLLKQEQE